METTLNVRGAVFRKLESAARMRSITRSALIRSLFKCMLDDAAMMVRTGMLIQYQERRASGEWHTVHVVFDAVENEYFQDLRKLSKMSLSLILALAVERYLDKDKTDNNRYFTYFIVKENVGLTVIWQLVWVQTPAFTRRQ
jgi:hypothetical protein